MKREPASSIADVRKTKADSRDPRVSRTRAAIFDAIESLLAKGGESISVAAIVDEAGVSRTSFYSHFAGFDELAVEIVQRSYVDLLSAERDRESEDQHHVASRESLELLVQHYVTHRPFYAAVAAHPMPRSIHTRAVRTLARQLEPGLARSTAMPSSVNPQLASSLIASAIVGFLDEWIEGAIEATSDELVEHLIVLLPPWFAK